MKVGIYGGSFNPIHFGHTGLARWVLENTDLDEVWLRVSDFEFHLPRPTYTANTMRALAREYPEHEFTLIIGEDNLQIFDKWRESDFLLTHFRIFVYPRHGCPIYEIPQARDLQILKNAPYFDISSTEIRKNLHK